MMRIETTRDDDEAIVLALWGRLDLVSAGSLRAAVATAVEGRGRTVVVDLEHVEFLDSSGLGALIAGLKASRQAGGDLRVAAPGEQARTVFQLTNLDRVLQLHDTVDGALGDA